MNSIIFSDVFCLLPGCCKLISKTTAKGSGWVTCCFLHTWKWPAMLLKFWSWDWDKPDRACGRNGFAPLLPSAEPLEPWHFPFVLSPPASSNCFSWAVMVGVRVGGKLEHWVKWIEMVKCQDISKTNHQKPIEDHENMKKRNTLCITCVQKVCYWPRSTLLNFQPIQETGLGTI